MYKRLDRAHRAMSVGPWGADACQPWNALSMERQSKVFPNQSSWFSCRLSTCHDRDHLPSLSERSSSAFCPFSREKAPDENPITDAQFRPVGSIAVNLRSLDRHQGKF